MNVAYLDVAFSRATDEAAFSGIHSQRLNSWVMGLEILALDLKCEVQHTDPAFSSSAEQQLLFGSKSQYSCSRLMAAKAWKQTETFTEISEPHLYWLRVLLPQNSFYSQKVWPSYPYEPSYQSLPMYIFNFQNFEAWWREFTHPATRALLRLLTDVVCEGLGSSQHFSSSQRPGHLSCQSHVYGLVYELNSSNGKL